MSEQSLRERFQALNEASSRQASQLAAEKTKVGMWGIVVSPGLTFLRVYFWQGAWRRGLTGLNDALFAAYEVFVRVVKVWELQQDQNSS